jgi:hypothetical protein
VKSQARDALDTDLHSVQSRPNTGRRLAQVEHEFNCNQKRNKHRRQSETADAITSSTSARIRCESTPGPLVATNGAGKETEQNAHSCTEWGYPSATNKSATTRGCFTALESPRTRRRLVDDCNTDDSEGRDSIVGVMP